MALKNQLTGQIAKHIHQVYFGKNWTWSNLKDNLNDVTWVEAKTKIDSFNTILTLVYHIHYFTLAITSVLEGKPLDAKDEFSFIHPNIESEKEWQEFLENIWKEAEYFVQLVEQLDDNIMWEVFSESKYGNYYRNLTGLVEHTHYHLGQIAILKKLIRSTESNLN